MERHRGRAGRWTWRLPMPMPWGQELDHPVRPLELLGFPLAFTQNDLLSPDDFVKRAGERGVQIRPEQPAAVIYGGRTVGARRPNVERLQLDQTHVFAPTDEHAVPA